MDKFCRKKKQKRVKNILDKSKPAAKSGSLLLYCFFVCDFREKN